MPGVPGVPGGSSDGGVGERGLGELKEPRIWPDMKPLIKPRDSVTLSLCHCDMNARRKQAAYKHDRLQARDVVVASVTQTCRQRCVLVMSK